MNAWMIPLLILSLATPARAAEAPAPPEKQGPSNTDLAKAAQNPVADMMSFPFQDNIGFGYGPDKQVQNVLNVQPVIPITLTEDWNIVTRTILPIVSQPNLLEGGGVSGLGNLNFTPFLSPARPGFVIWGIGPIASFPTATSPALGSQSTWGLGVNAVALAMPGPWVLGILANNVWSVAGARANAFLMQYFVNLNFHDGWYLTSSPILTANWEAPSGQQWVVPFGAGGGKIFRIAGVPFNGNVQAFYNVVKPSNGPDWTLRVQLALLLPR